MKKIIFTLFVGLVIFVVSGCKTPRNTSAVVDMPQQKAQIINPKDFPVWKQEIYWGLSIGDPANFLNSAKILLDGEVFHQTLRLENGKFKTMDTIHPIAKSVPEHTLGELIYPLVKDAAGRIIQMNISFSFNDASYKFNFQRRSDGSFSLNGNATIIVDGVEYPIQASSIGICLLLIDLSSEPTIIPENGTAEGRPVQGVKEIKIK